MRLGADEEHWHWFFRDGPGLPENRGRAEFRTEDAILAVLSRGWMRRGWLRRLLLCPPLLCMPLMTGCLYHTRKLAPVTAPQVEITTDATQLAESINRVNDSIQTLSA